jgi:alkylation response protein AidB-like acyl-CoA dehydrogenase
MLKSELKKFAQQVILDKVDEFDKACTFPIDHIKQLADMGILGALVPEEYDGAGLDLIGFVVSLEEMSKVCASTATVVATHNAFFVFPILKYGNEDQKKKYLPGAATGAVVGGFACVGTNRASATKTGENYLVKGSDPLVFNAASQGPLTGFFPVKDGDRTLLACVVDEDAKIARKETSAVLGLRSAGIRQVVFNDLTLSASSILGNPENGHVVLNDTRDCAIICFAAILVGIAQGALDEAIKYARERIQFDQPIINFGMVREKIALMATHIEASRQLVYDAALLYDAGKKLQPAASKAKYLAGQTAIEVTTQAIQIFGGYGYMKDYPVERYFRDAQVVNVIGGTPAMQKELIAKETIG